MAFKWGMRKMWSDQLTTKEAEYTQHVIENLSSIDWVRPLLARFHKAGGLKSENMPIMFELRFAHELHRAGVSAQYEFPAGVGQSTVDFKTNTTPPFLIELASIRESKAAKGAIEQTGPFYEQVFSDYFDDPTRSETGEMIKAQEKIAEKVTKFPPVTDSVHVVLADMRGYLAGLGDHSDFREIAYGRQGLPRNASYLAHWWRLKPGEYVPIKGLFETSNPLRAAQWVQERIHILGFVRERQYREGEIKETSYYLRNPHFFADQRCYDEAFRNYPLRPTNPGGKTDAGM